MGRKPVYTFAKWRVKDGQLAAVLGLLGELMAKSTAEEGNLLYKVHQSNSDANTLILLSFTLHSRWREIKYQQINALGSVAAIKNMRSRDDHGSLDSLTLHK